MAERVVNRCRFLAGKDPFNSEVFIFTVYRRLKNLLEMLENPSVLTNEIRCQLVGFIFYNARKARRV